MLFSGPPGTGKTMAAQVVTNQLHMRLYKIQLSQIISKYIGETEKNLKKVFTEAKNANCVLFFDEMDALFGKRSEVKDSHDRHANIETAYLLQQMEEYDGVVLMATNLLQNIDEAFMRRISFVISFPFPDTATRKLLWQKMFDADAPMSEDVDYDFLAEAFKIAGGNIKNCVVHAAFLAASEGVPVSMRHILRSVVKEQRKNNIIVLKDDLREYADLVFGTE
ncbi:MAG: ATP-binding protein [Oscillospiraceae bacterium]|nr:ATP-binding protein [Oscillospiraceae bacterium]